MQRLSWVVAVVVAAVVVAACGSVSSEPDASVPTDGTGAVDGPAVDAAPVQQGAAMWLKLDDAPGDGVTDSAGTHVATCTLCPTQVAGKVGTAYAFTNDRVTVAAATDLQPGTGFTLAMWVRVDTAPPAATGNAIIACKNLGDLDCTYAVSVSPGLVPQFYSSSDTNSNLDANATLPLGTWHHIAVTWDGSTKTVFFDGTMNRTGAARTMGNNASAGMTLGERQSANMPLTFAGAIDELLFFNRALSGSEIARLAMP